MHTQEKMTVLVLLSVVLLLAACGDDGSETTTDDVDMADGLQIYAATCPDTVGKGAGTGRSPGRYQRCAVTRMTGRPASGAFAASTSLSPAARSSSPISSASTMVNPWCSGPCSSPKRA